MFSSTGLAGLSGTVFGALAGALLSGAPHAMAATRRVDSASSDFGVLRMGWLPHVQSGKSSDVFMIWRRVLVGVRLRVLPRPGEELEIATRICLRDVLVIK